MIELSTARVTSGYASNNDQLFLTNSKEPLATSIQKFNYATEHEVTFTSWFNSYEESFHVDGAFLDEEFKVCLLLQKFGSSDHSQYCNYILPHSREFPLKETVSKLSSIVGEKASLFNIKSHCLKIARQPEEEIASYSGRVNKQYERFQPKEITND